MRANAIAVLGTLIALPSSLFSQQSLPANTAVITYSVGKVSIQPGGKGDWTKGRPGQELSDGDNLWADMNSQVEIHAKDTAVMVGPETSMVFDQLGDSEIKLNLRLGSVIVQMPASEESMHWEVGTPNLRFTLSEAGDYRLDVNGEGNETAITAKRGHGQAIADGAPYKVMAGQHVRFMTKNHLEVEVGEIPEPDSFDIWAADHNRPEHHNEEVADVVTDPSVTESASRRVWESNNGDAGHWVYLDGLGPAWVPIHWSESILLPMPSAGVILAEDPSSQETSASFSRQHVVLKGMQQPMVYSPLTQSVPVHPTQVSSQHNTARSAPAQGYAGPGPMQSVSHNHDQPRPSPIFVPRRMDPPRISPPKPATPAQDKPKKQN